MVEYSSSLFLKKYERVSFRNREIPLEILPSFFKIARITIHRHFKNYYTLKKKKSYSAPLKKMKMILKFPRLA